MWCFTITTLTFLLISINPTLSNLKKSELQDAIDAFDSFDTRPVRSISPRHKDTGTDAGIKYIPGAPTAIDVHSKLARDLALFFICEYNKITFPYNYFLVDIWSGTQQVVKGIKYVMDVVAGNVSGCREGAPADNCQLKSNVNLYGCHFEIIDQPWLNRTELLDFDCVPINPLKDVTNKQNNRRKVKFNSIDKEPERVKDYMKRHSKIYDDIKEFEKRFHIFKANLKK